MTDNSTWSPFRLSERQLFRIQMVLAVIALMLSLGCVMLLILR